MHYRFLFAHPAVLLLTVPAVLCAIWYRLVFYKSTEYCFPLTRWLQRKNQYCEPKAAKISFILYAVCALIGAFLVARPQLVDVTSMVRGEGIDIMVLLDVSGSMLCFDDMSTKAKRIESAKQEAVRFIDKRAADRIGLVIFGRDAVSRIPLTLDKGALKEVVNSLRIGIVPEDGTVLAKGIAVAACRLKASRAKTKIIILLTDGEPTQEDGPIESALALANQLGIKIYTIGIGGQVGYFEHPQLGIIANGSSLNVQLLEYIAQQTGGRFFQAQHERDLRTIYDTIDQLEKTEYETTVFSTRYDLYVPFVLLILLLICIELILSGFVWFTL